MVIEVTFKKNPSQFCYKIELRNSTILKKIKREMMTDRVYKYCRERNYNMALKLTERNIPCDWNRGLVGATESNDYTLVLLAIKRGANNLNAALGIACRRGYRELITLLMSKGANNVDHGMIKACEGGHYDIVCQMIKLGARMYDQGLRAACYGEHRDLIALMIQQGATDMNLGLLGACASRDISIVELMISYGAENYRDGLLVANQYGHSKIAELLQCIITADEIDARIN